MVADAGVASPVAAAAAHVVCAPRSPCASEWAQCARDAGRQRTRRKLRERRANIRQ